MFEKIKGENAIRPKYIATIENKYARRAAMISVWPFTCLIVVASNVFIYLFVSVVMNVRTFWRYIPAPIFKMVKTTFSKWDYWDTPRQD